MIIAPEDKQLRQALRLKFREQRKALSDEQQSEAGLLLVKQCQQLALCKPYQHIAIYLSNDGELNTAPLIDYLWKHNVNVYLPVIDPALKGHLLFVCYTPSSPMTKNQFGILEPDLSVLPEKPPTKQVSDIDVLFTPLVAFDNAGNRLGMGGGFYDRTLGELQCDKNKKINADIKPKLIGLAHDVQKTANLPAQAWDIPLEHILTPTHFYSFTS
jgi:5-formyltetrahydrofolate cyclo-ligase